MNAILPVCRRSLGESWRGLIGWTAGLWAVALLYLPIYPSMAGNGQMAELVKSLPQELTRTIGYDQISTGSGYVQSTYFGLMGFLLTTIAAVAWGSRAIAGFEESGRLEIDLAHGIGRMQYSLEQALAILVRLLWLGAASTALIWILNTPSKLDLDPAHLVGAAASLLALAALHAAVGLLAGALSGRRAWTLGAAAGVAVLGYVLQAVAKQSPDGAWLRHLSPYSWVFHDAPLTNGADLPMLLLTWGLAVVMAFAAAFALRSRDLHG